MQTIDVDTPTWQGRCLSLTDRCKRISVADFRRALSVGRKVALVHRTSGPVDPPQVRTVKSNTATKIVFDVDGKTADLHFGKGDQAYLVDGIGWGIAPACVRGAIALLYVPAE